VILDLSSPVELVPLLVLIGLILVFLGRETLEVLSFAIGALSGGIIAYMILKGLLFSYTIPLWVELVIASLIIFGGGMFGRGAMATMLAMASALVFADLFHALLGPDLLFVTIILGVVLFALFVAIIQKYVIIFSSFIGGAVVAIGLNTIPLDDVILLRIAQVVLALILTAIGSIVQYRIKKWKETRGEKVIWVPTSD